MSLLNTIEDLDQQLLLFINSLHSTFMDELMWNISSKWFPVPFYIIVLLLLVKKYSTKQLLLGIALVAASVGLADLISKELLKETIQRFRPTHNLNIKDSIHIVNDYRGGVFGFVSSHAANMVAFATMSVLLIRKKWLTIVLVLFAFIVGYSRMYLGVHYPLDILGGALVGTLVAYVLYRLTAKYCQFE